MKPKWGILAVLVRENRWMTALEIHQAVYPSDWRRRTGTHHVPLAQLEIEGFVSKRWDPDSGENGSPRRRQWHVVGERIPEAVRIIQREQGSSGTSLGQPGISPA